MADRIWQCLGCGAIYTSDAARQECEREDREADRDARRR